MNQGIEEAVYGLAIGTRLHAVRRAKRPLVTQEDLARRVGVSTHFLGRIERGRAMPSITTFRALCVALGCRPSDLLDVQVAAEVRASPEVELPSKVAKLVHALRLAPPRVVRLASEIAAALDGDDEAPTGGSATSD